MSTTTENGAIVAISSGWISRPCVTRLAKSLLAMMKSFQGTLTCLIGGGHVLLEGVPGLGKTMLVADPGRCPCI